jgi:hypothetical protein
MTGRIVTSTYRYKRPPGKRKPCYTNRAVFSAGFFRGFGLAFGCGLIS